MSLGLVVRSLTSRAIAWIYDCRVPQVFVVAYSISCWSEHPCCTSCRDGRSEKNHILTLHPTKPPISNTLNWMIEMLRVLWGSFTCCEYQHSD